MVAHVLMQQINKSKRWYATCDCGRYWFGTRKECDEGIKQHGASDGIIIGPRIITWKSTISIPHCLAPGQIGRERWCWSAHNEKEEADPWYHGSGRTEWEAIENLDGVNDVRRMTILDLKEGFPKNRHWLEQPHQEDDRCIDKAKEQRVSNKVSNISENCV